MDHQLIVCEGSPADDAAGRKARRLRAALSTLALAVVLLGTGVISR